MWWEDIYRPHYETMRHILGLSNHPSDFPSSIPFSSISIRDQLYPLTWSMSLCCLELSLYREPIKLGDNCCRSDFENGLLSPFIFLFKKRMYLDSRAFWIHFLKTTQLSVSCFQKLLCQNGLNAS